MKRSDASLARGKIGMDAIRKGASDSGTFTAPPPAFIVSGVSAAEATLEIRNRLGLHLRAASALAQSLKQFDSSVTLSMGDHQANAKSVTSLIMLGASQGTKLKARAEGPDAQAALAAMKSLFEARFGEE